VGGGRRRRFGRRDRRVLPEGRRIAAFLLLHGADGTDDGHWQTWLAARLRDQGHDVSFPDLPDAAMPRVSPWLEALDRELAPGATVLTHSLGGLLWLHHAARMPGVQAARVLLVAPSQPDEDQPESAGFRPAPLSREGVAAAARETQLVCSTNDPWCPRETSRRVAEAIGAPIHWLEDAGHINTSAGYGPWPWIEEWALR
jgi:uncharacterized protein